MTITETFGHWVEQLNTSRPEQARRLLKTGWAAQRLRFGVAPDRRLLPADRYLACLMMDTMRAPLRRPRQSALVSVFTPCQLLHEVGLHPYNAESMSCYLSASRADAGCIQRAEADGIAETLCSYHKTCLGAAESGLLPAPLCVVYTNLTCDANMLTFRHLAELYGVPSFFIDVPIRQDKDSVTYVAGQLRELAAFLEQQTGKKVDEDSLRARLARSERTRENYRQFQQTRAGRCIPTDLVTPMYAGMTAHILLGTEEEERYTQMLLRDVSSAPPAQGKRIYWMHTIPFWSDAVKELLCFKDSAQIVGEELCEACDYPIDPEHPYEAMAARMVYHALNGPVTHRIELGIRHARQAGADGAVWFCHWGCKHTLGGAQLAKKKFEAAGIPLLLLDGDGCDRSHGGEGQTATRLGAFLEMLEEGRHE